MNGKTCLVTGATAGIGLATAEALAGLGAKVIMVGRDRERGGVARRRVQEASGNQAVELLLADLSSLAQVRQLAELTRSSYRRLDVLVNNAGGFFWDRRVSSDGFELNWALNYLSPFTLTNLLLPLLKSSVPARIINVSSDAHKGASLNFADLQFERGYVSHRAYGQSKLALVVFTYELARRLEGSGVTANVVHPGFVASDIYRKAGWPLRVIAPLLRLIAAKPEKGARSSVFLASAPEVAGASGGYYIDCQRAESSPASRDPKSAERLWRISAAMTGL